MTKRLARIQVLVGLLLMFAIVPLAQAHADIGDDTSKENISDIPSQQLGEITNELSALHDKVDALQDSKDDYSLINPADALPESASVYSNRLSARYSVTNSSSYVSDVRAITFKYPTENYLFFCTNNSEYYLLVGSDLTLSGGHAKYWHWYRTDNTYSYSLEMGEDDFSVTLGSYSYISNLGGVPLDNPSAYTSYFVLLGFLCLAGYSVCRVAFGWLRI